MIVHIVLSIFVVWFFILAYATGRERDRALKELDKAQGEAAHWRHKAQDYREQRDALMSSVQSAMHFLDPSGGSGT